MIRAWLIATALTVAALALPALASGAGSVTYACQPAPEDCTGWYHEPVRHHADGPAGPRHDRLRQRDLRARHAGHGEPLPRDQRLHHVGPTVVLRVDQTPPVVTGAVPARPPDHDGWYVKPIALAFAGTDETSGIASCTSVTYAGPPSATAAVPGTCTDAAGNVSAPLPFTLRFDATPPAIRLERTPGDRQVRLRWRVPADTVRVRISRAPSTRRAGVTVFTGKGKGRSFIDRHVLNGHRYVYRLVATDAAGNTASKTFATRPGLRLLSPASGHRLARAPLLTWTPVRGARYYNVQFFHGTRKVLSRWPRSARFQLPKLADGTYTWVVWPGEGALAERRYGAELALHRARRRDQHRHALPGARTRGQGPQST